LGIGWGSVNSHDMVIRLLANSGIIGLTSFVLILLYIFYNLILSLFRYKIYSDILINYLCGISISISTTLFVSMIGGFAYYFSHFWFILGISIALITIIKRNSISKNIPRSIPL
jgi:O-antigen ligase